MRPRLALLVLPPLLAGCSTGADLGRTVDDALRANSGAVRAVQQGVSDTVELGKQGVKAVQEGLTEAEKRAADLQEAAKKADEARRLLEQGIRGRSTSSR